MNKIMDFLKRKKKLVRLILIILFVILLAIFIITSVVKGNRKRECNSLREKIIANADLYLEDKSLFPTLNGTSITIDLANIDEVVFKDEYVTGVITYTKYNDTYVKTLDISNASYCDTKEFKKESGYDENKNAKVEVSFNYYKVDSYNSQWTNYLASEYINTTETDGVLLPIDSKYLPKIPNNAVITEYVRETKEYYSYRDKKWKWYKNNINYSEYSSEKPNGYTNKDTLTKTTTDTTEWSLDYPEKKDYRHVKSTTGYRWYILDDKEKIYWENGKYSPTSPGDEYKKDAEQKATMYCYYDDMWRWYNGTVKREYSSYYSLKPSGYNFKDKDTLTYSNWTSFKDESELTNSNKAYREERTDIYSRYLIKYDIYSLPMLKENVSLEELENIIGKSYQEISEDKSLHVEVNFKFKYEA